MSTGNTDRSDVPTGEPRIAALLASVDLTAYHAELDDMRLEHGVPGSTVPTVLRRYPCDWEDIYRDRIHTHYCRMLSR